MRRKMKTSFGWASIRLAIAALMLVPGLVSAAEADAIAMTAAQQETLGVRTAAPQPATEYPALSASGTVSVPPQAAFMVTALHDGIVKQVLVGVGQNVKQGELLAWLNSPATVDLQQQYLSAVYAEKLAAQTRERDRALLNDGVISQKRFQESESAWRQAHTRLLAAAQSLSQAGFSQDDLNDLRKTGSLKRETPLRAPVSGTVLEQLAGPGDRVSANDPVYRLADLSQLWVDVRLPAEDVNQTAIGRPVQVDGHGGKVTQVAGAVDPVTHTVLVRAEMTGDVTGLRPGTFVEVRFLQPVPHAFSLPAAAVVSSGEQTVMFVQTATGFQAQPVTVLGRDADRVYLQGDAEAGRQVAITGVAAIKAAWLGMGGE